MVLYNFLYTQASPKKSKPQPKSQTKDQAHTSNHKNPQNHQQKTTKKHKQRNWQHHKIALWPSGHWARNFGLYLLHTRNVFTVSSYRVAQELQVPCDDGIMFLEIYISTCCNSQKWQTSQNTFLLQICSFPDSHIKIQKQEIQTCVMSGRLATLQLLTSAVERKQIF